MLRKLAFGDQSGQATLLGVMAVMILVISVAAGMRYVGPKVTLQASQATPTQSKEVIQKALWAFVARNYRLPCPADGTAPQGGTGKDGIADGFEDCNLVSGGSSSANANRGVVPWKALGLSYSDALDGWNRRIGYAASSGLVTGTPYKSSQPTSSDAIELSVNGGTASKYAYVLISYGYDGEGAWLLSGSQIAAPPSTSEEYADTEAGSFTGAGPSTFASWTVTTTIGQTGSTSNSYYDHFLLYEQSWNQSTTAAAGVCADINGKLSFANWAYCTGGCSQDTCPQDYQGTSSNTSGTNPTSAVSILNSSNQTASANSTAGSTVIYFGSPNNNKPNAASAQTTGATSTNQTYTGSSLSTNTSACLWFENAFNWTTQTLVAYLEFSLPYDPITITTSGTQQGDGFTFSLIPGSTSISSSSPPCGGSQVQDGVLPTGANGDEQGSWMGFGNLANTNSTATGVATVGAGALKGVTVTTAGTGYTSAPAVTFTPTDGGSGASATASLGGTISAIEVTSVGSYSAVPTVTISGGGCSSGCDTATATMEVASITVSTIGSGYTSAPTVTVGTAKDFGCTSSCTNAKASSTLGHVSGTTCVSGSPTGSEKGCVLSVTVTTAGKGYTSDPSVAFSGGGCGTGCTEASASSALGVEAVTLSVDTGSYTSQPSVTFGAGTTTATGVAAMGVLSVTMSSFGSGYITAPTVGFGSCNVSPCTNAAGSVTTDYATITGIDITNGGSGFTTVANTIVDILPASTDTTGSGATLTLQSGDVVNGSIQTGTYTPTTAGSNYTAVPTVSFESLIVPRVALEFRTYEFLGDPPNGFADTTSIRHDPTGAATTFAEAMSTLLVDTGYRDNTWHTSESTTVPSGYSAADSNPYQTSTSPSIVDGTINSNCDNPITGGNTGGSGASATATESGGEITAIALDSAGSGYTSSPTVTISGGATTSSSSFVPAAAHATLTVGSVTVTSPGSGYTSRPTVKFTTATGDSETGGATVATSGVTLSVVSVAVSAGGGGYVTAPTVTFSGGGGNGTGTAATATISGGAVSAITITSDGSGYTSKATVKIATAAESGCTSHCSNATGTATMGVATITPDAGGTYLMSPTIAISGGGCGSGCTTATASPSMEVGAIALDSEGGGYSSTPTVAFAGGGCSWDSTAESNILTDDFCWNESGGTCASTGSPTDPATGAALTSYAATDITTGGTTSFLNYYHPLRIEAQRYCNSTCSSCGQSTTSGDTYMLIRAFLDCDDGALGGTTGQHTLCQSLTTQYLTGSGAVFPFSSSSGYSGAYTVNYCVIDPGANSALGITAFDSVYMGITVGAGSAQTGLLIRNFSPSIISSTTN